MDFFPDPPAPPDDDPRPQAQPLWSGPPEDVIPGIVPVELVLGRSDTTVVFLTGMRAFPTGLGMTLGVRVRGPLRGRRRDLSSEVFDGPYPHDMGPAWQAGRLKWGFELADGRRVTNVDPAAWCEQPNQDHHRPTTRTTGSGNPTTRCSPAEAVAVGRGRSTATTGCGRCPRPGGGASFASGRSRTSPRRCTTSTRSRSSTLPPAPDPCGRARDGQPAEALAPMTGWGPPGR